VNGEESCFCMAEAVMRLPLLCEHLRLSVVEQQELLLCMSRFRCPVPSLKNANECA
jgi:hypothetical protein